LKANSLSAVLVLLKASTGCSNPLFLVQFWPRKTVSIFRDNGSRAIVFYRNFCSKTASHFSEIALEPVYDLLWLKE